MYSACVNFGLTNLLFCIRVIDVVIYDVAFKAIIRRSLTLNYENLK